MAKEENRIRKIKQSYELRINNLEERYNSIIAGKNKLIEKYESEIEFYRELVRNFSNKSITVENQKRR